MLPREVLAVLCRFVTSSLLNSISSVSLTLWKSSCNGKSLRTHGISDPVKLCDSHLACLFVTICYPDRVDAPVDQRQSGRQQRASQHCFVSYMTLVPVLHGLPIIRMMTYPVRRPTQQQPE